jgi:hypothetical protein
MKVHALVFSKDDSRFLIPGFWYSDDDPELGLGSRSSVLCESMLMTIASDMKSEEFIELEADENGQGGIAHKIVKLSGSRFRNGGFDVLVISGPLFEDSP